jgi:hypothetical protein
VNRSAVLAAILRGEIHERRTIIHRAERANRMASSRRPPGRRHCAHGLHRIVTAAGLLDSARRLGGHVTDPREVFRGSNRTMGRV